MTDETDETTFYDGTEEETEESTSFEGTEETTSFDELVQWTERAGKVLEVGMIVKDGVHGMKKVWQAKTALEGAGEAVGAGIAVAIGTFILLIEFETPPLTLSDQTMQLLADSASGSGYSDLFLAVCESTDHSDTGDYILDRGLWHAPACYDSFQPAVQDAQVHLSEHPEELGYVYVAHFQVATPNEIEMLQIQ